MLPKSVRDELAAKGHQLDIRDVKGVGSVKAVLIDSRTGVALHGADEVFIDSSRVSQVRVAELEDCGFRVFAQAIEYQFAAIGQGEVHLRFR